MRTITAGIALVFTVTACASDAPELSEASSEVTVATSSTCNQGPGAQSCVQVWPYESTTSTSRWQVDGVKSPLEYAGSVGLPFVPDQLLSGLAGSKKLQATGKVHIQRVTFEPQPFGSQRALYVYFEDIPFLANATDTKLRIYLDNDRFADDSGSVASNDRRFTIDLASGTTVKTESPTATTPVLWLTAATGVGTSYKAGGCRTVSTFYKVCSGEMRIPLGASVDVAPAPGLDPGIGLFVRTVTMHGSAPQIGDTLYARSDYDRRAWQTVLFAPPVGFDLSFMTWNVRRFVEGSPLETTGFQYVKPEDIGRYLADNDIVTLQEGWDRTHVQRIVNGANARRAELHKKPLVAYGPVNFEPGLSDLLTKVVDGVEDTQGGLWTLSSLPIMNRDYLVFSDSTCVAEDCFKAKGVQWTRFYLRDPDDIPPECLKTPAPGQGCDKPASGDDFIDVFNTHLQADDAELCSTTASVIKTAISIALEIWGSAFGGWATVLRRLLDADLNCGTAPPTARSLQLAELNNFVKSKAASDRASIVMGDFNVNGRRWSGEEYVNMLRSVGIAGSANGDDRVSAIGGGPDIQHGDVLRERPDVLSTGQCTGTSIGETGGTSASCSFAGNFDGNERFDYILVRPPVLRTEATEYPRWSVRAADGYQKVWTSPFPSLTGAIAASPPKRLSDHKPVKSSLTIYRDDHLPLYDPTWRHAVEQRVVGYDATDTDDCLGCGEVDMFADMISTILPNGAPSFHQSNVCEGNQAASYDEQDVLSCMTDWAIDRTHTPPNETAIQLKVTLYDEDGGTAGDATQIGFPTYSTQDYASGTLRTRFIYSAWGQSMDGPWMPNLEEVSVGLCFGVVSTCHRITLTPLSPGE